MKLQIFKNNSTSIIILFFLVSSNWILSILPSIFNENFVLTTIYSIIYFFILVSIQMIIIFFIFKNNFFNKINFINILILSLFLSFNLYTLILSTSSFFIFSNYKMKLLFCLISLIIVIFLITLIFEKKKIINILILFYLAINAYYILNYFIINIGNEIKIERNLKKIKIISGINIHIFSFEALIPSSVAKQNLGVEKVLYDEVLKKNNFRILQNNFADNIATSDALNSILYGNTIQWRSISNKKKYSFFSGRSNSPLMQILRNNGYKIYTGYYHQYMGQPGKFVDEYLTFRSIKIKNNKLQKIYPTFCQFKMPWYHFQLFGYCDFLKVIFKTNKSNEFVDATEFNNHFIEKVMNDDTKPIFSILHLYSPGHVTANLKGLNYVNYFKEKRLEVETYFNSIIKNLKRNKNKKSIIIIIGDNGSFQTWDSLENDKSFIKFKKNQKDFDKFKIIDRYAVFGSYYLHNLKCDNEENQILNNLYNTNGMLINKLMYCISNKDEYFNKDIKYNLPGNVEYSNFIYE